MRIDNALHVRTDLLKPTTGKDKKNCVRLSKESFAIWDQHMVENNIVQGSKANPLWKVGEDKANQSPWPVEKKAKKKQWGRK